MDRQDVGPARTAGPWKTRIAPALWRASGVMLWLQAIRFIPKALQSRQPVIQPPKASMPSSFHEDPCTCCCQRRIRMELPPLTICRAEAKISAQVNSIVGSDLYQVNHCTISHAARTETSSDAFPDYGRGDKLEIGKALMTCVAGGTLEHNATDIKRRQQPLKLRRRIGKVVC